MAHDFPADYKINIKRKDVSLRQSHMQVKLDLANRGEGPLLCSALFPRYSNRIEIQRLERAAEALEGHTLSNDVAHRRSLQAKANDLRNCVLPDDDPLFTIFFDSLLKKRQDEWIDICHQVEYRNATYLDQKHQLLGKLKVER